jgi:hypothetical protein
LRVDRSRRLNDSAAIGRTAARHFPAPWRADKIPGGYVVRDANGQANRGAAGQGADERPGTADRRQCRAAAEAAWETARGDGMANRSPLTASGRITSPWLQHKWGLHTKYAVNWRDYGRFRWQL